MNSKCAKYSYRLLSVGIEEQSRNALVKERIILSKQMENISEKEMATLLGGSADICRELIGEGNAHKEDPNYDWDTWADLVGEYC